jgi:hypothetical protein
MAVRPNLPNGDIHVYAHSKHSDHPIQPAGDIDDFLSELK